LAGPHHYTLELRVNLREARQREVSKRERVIERVKKTNTNPNETQQTQTTT